MAARWVGFTYRQSHIPPISLIPGFYWISEKALKRIIQSELFVIDSTKQYDLFGIILSSGFRSISTQTLVQSTKEKDKNKLMKSISII
jgi:hypothetical protein